MIDTSGEFGARADRRLREEKVIWLTTVDPGGVPQPAPVWFLYDGETVVVYSLNSARRLRNIEADPHVALNLNSTSRGGDVIVLTGTARIAPEIPPPAENEVYLARYREWIAEETSWDRDAQEFGRQYGTPIAIDHLKLHGW